MKFKLLLIGIVISTLFVFSAVAAETEWAFDTMDKLHAWTENSKMLQYEIKNGKCEFVPMGNGAHISFIPAEKIYLDEYNSLVLRAGSDTEGAILKVIFETEDVTFETEIVLKGDAQWYPYTSDIHTYGELKGITVYFVTESYADKTAHITIDRIGLFSDAEKAQYFLEKSLISLKEKEPIVSADSIEPPKWLFYDSTTISDWTIEPEYINEPGALKLLISESGGAISKSPDTAFQALEFRYFALRYKASGSVDGMMVRINSDDKADSHIPINNDGSWHNFITDMSKYSHRRWKDYIDHISFLFDKAGDVTVERIGFFTNYTDASAFLQEGQRSDDYLKEKVFKGDNYKIIVPGDTMKEAYDINDISIHDIAHAKDFKNGVVMLNDTPVPTSEVTSGGYVVYTAREKGKYTLGEYAKDYSDTDTHWAGEYIDYVSSRTLFSGTSPTEFSPDMTITRGMFITVLGRMDGVDTADIDGEIQYSDVDSEMYYAPYIKWASKNGIFTPQGELFMPNDPIKRGEMALVISNYIDYRGYNFSSFSPATQFGDIADCSYEIQTAIRKIQALSIINGKSTYVFDPYGVSTRAEASAVFTRLIKSILGVYFNSPYDAEYFGKEKIHIGAYANFDIDALNENLLTAYKDAGFNTVLLSGEIAKNSKRDYVLDYCDKYGINAIIPIETDDSPWNEAIEFSDRPSYFGCYIAEEPGSESFDEIASLVDGFAQGGGDARLFVNLLPLYASENQFKYGAVADYPAYYSGNHAEYEAYCTSFTSVVNSDIFMTNILPYSANGIYDEYIESVALASKYAFDGDKKFWCLIQSDTSVTEKSQLLRQYYTLLSFGCKDFLLWLWSEGICDANSDLTDTYSAVAAANAEINAISDVFTEYDYKYTAIYNSQKNYDITVYTNILSTHDGMEISSTQPVIVGSFTGDDGLSRAYTFVNASEFDDTVSVKLDCSEFVVYNNGVPQNIYGDESGFYTLDIPAGEGMFVTVK